MSWINRLLYGDTTLWGLTLAVSTLSQLVPTIMGFISAIICMALSPLSLPPSHKPYPALLTTPRGRIFAGLNINQCRHIITRLGGGYCELLKVILVAPLGGTFYHFNAVQAERICRDRGGWYWYFKGVDNDTTGS